MKTTTVFEARNHFARTREAAKKDVIIVTRNGRPAAAIQARDDDDIDDLFLLGAFLGNDRARPPREANCDREAAQASHRATAETWPATALRSRRRDR